ncbi:hypothetical protein COX67_03445, partial [Candidatus Falkowbacteria bacterium CG_4_10_14_0_2_um_filter_36_22]
LLEEKNQCAQIKNCEENFFAGWRGFRATAGLASLLGVLLKKSSNINQKTPHFINFTMIQPIKLEHPSKKLLFLIHGYTGSPTDFNGLPEYLHKTLNINVKVMLLKGHGTNIKDLDSLEFNDFLVQAKRELRKDLQKYDEVFLGGVSFGAQLALYLAAHYPVKAVFNACLPYKLKFPFNIPKLELIGIFKKYWLKHIPETEKRLRQNAFHYKEMHIKGLKIVKQANRKLKKTLTKIYCPVLSIHSEKDPIGNYKTIDILDNKIKGPHDKKILRIFNDKNHNIFFTENRFDIYKKIEDFLKSSQKNNNFNSKRVAAIIPAYNEGNNIADVLSVLSRTKILNEIIVVDDGSTDKTPEAVKNFGQVKLLRNNKNKGKAYSMQRGMDATKADIIFFCDADLKGLTPSMVEQIIQPVINQKYDMYIGLRNNVMQKAVNLFALNSGERALTRALWEKLPENFKYRYRIEAGLNFIARKRGRGYGWQKFDYYQTLKEKKYGIIKGTILRWWMNFDVGCAYALAIVQNFSRKKSL